MYVLWVPIVFVTVSYEAFGVISSITLREVMAMEVKRIYDRVRITSRTLTTEERREERQKTLDEWQIKWDTARKGIWTHRFIGDIQTWVERKQGPVDFYMTQFLIGQGCFKEISL